MKALIKVIERRKLGHLWIMSEIQNDVEVIHFVYLEVTNDRGKRRKFSLRIGEVRRYEIRYGCSTDLVVFENKGS